MKKIVFCLVLLVFHGLLLADDLRGDRYEQNLLDAIEKIQRLDHELALSSTRDLLRQYPNSRLGHMLYADLLLAKAEPLTRIGSGIATDQVMQDFQYEIQQRWQHDASPAYRGMYPDNILFVADSQPYVVLVDQQQSRVYIYRNQQGRLELETDYFVTIGLKGYGKQKRGDQKTPIGIYHVTRYIDGDELPDLYGAGAFPISYPNAWDQRLQRTGDGIWIHGTPSNTYNRSPWASDGCIVVSNPDFVQIDQYVHPDRHTPVIMAEQVNWISFEQWQQRRREALGLLTTWLDDWQSLDHERYRGHYSRTELDAYGRDFRRWDGHKRWVSRNKTWIDVQYSDLNIFRYPGEDGLLLMQFEQTYRSNNLDVAGPKEVFWRERGNRWQIVYEGARRFPVPDTTIVEN